MGQCGPVYSLGRTLDILREEKIKTGNKIFPLHVQLTKLSNGIYMSIRESNFLLKISIGNELNYSVLSF